MNNILAIDTVSDMSSVALNGINLVWQSDRNQSMELLPKIVQLTDQAELTFKDLTGVVAVNGPGSYTGVRIGVSVANAIGLAAAVEVRAIDTLMAQVYWLECHEEVKWKELHDRIRILSILSAGQERVYGRWFDKHKKPLDEFRMDEIGRFFEDENDEIIVVGEVDEKVENWLKSTGIKNFIILRVDDKISRAGAVALNYKHLARTKNNIAIPLYLRGPIGQKQ